MFQNKWIEVSSMSHKHSLFAFLVFAFREIIFLRIPQVNATREKNCGR